MFEQASRVKLRISTTRGTVSVEDLWDLPLTSANNVSLDGIAKALNRKIREEEEESFVNAKTCNKDMVDTKLAFEIVKHIINVRLAEAEARKEANNRKARNEAIRELIARKEGQELEGKTIEELKAMLQ